MNKLKRLPNKSIGFNNDCVENKLYIIEPLLVGEIF